MIEVSRKLTVFEPVTIVLNTAEDLENFRQMVDFAYEEAARFSDVEETAEQLIDQLNKVS